MAKKLRRNILKIRKKLEKIEEKGYFSGEEIFYGVILLEHII